MVFEKQILESYLKKEEYTGRSFFFPYQEVLKLPVTHLSFLLSMPSNLTTTNDLFIWM